ncbi:hypothetical protein FA95DRAFT_1619055 [Auriscalpium vulgare]|uniref:Uncharacterized protein n=1 Tax=Auriscalpium vulgare TaxID=40419 RepID=A0ACB8R0Y6_9AGAM|nr:hypothetical protein FA95DRAFT_1619055 [Auriscalpium vulgare]
MPNDDPRWLYVVTSLADASQTRFLALGTISDLNDTITLLKEVLKQYGNPGHLDNMDGLAIALKHRFEKTGALLDLTEAISVQRQALNLTSKEDIHYSTRLHNVSALLYAQVEQLGNISIIEEAISLNQEDLRLRPFKDDINSKTQDNLANMLLMCFEQSGTMANLEKAIQLHQEAVELTPIEHPLCSTRRHNLAGSLTAHFYERGNMSDLETAMSLTRDAIRLSPQAWEEEPTSRRLIISIKNLASILSMRFHELDTMSNLEEAISLYKGLLDMDPVEKLDHVILGNLAGDLLTQYQHKGDLSDLNEAVLLQRQSLSLIVPGHLHYLHFEKQLGNLLRYRFKDLGRELDLEESILHLTNVAKSTPSSHPHYSKNLTDLAKALDTRLKTLNTKHDLVHIIVLLQAACNSFSLGHPEKIDSLYLLATSLYQFEQTFHPTGISDNTWTIFKYISVYEYASPRDRLGYTIDWAVVSRHYKHQFTSFAYHKALNLLERCLVIRPTLELQHSFFQSLDTSRHTLARDSVSWAIENGKLDEAVELWEQGRGILWAKMKDYRLPIEKLKLHNEILAKEFEITTHQLNQMTTIEPPSITTQYQREKPWEMKRKLIDKWSKIIKEIQSLEGFKTFLKPLPFSILSKVALEGPVTITLNRFFLQPSQAKT